MQSPPKHDSRAGAINVSADDRAIACIAQRRLLVGLPISDLIDLNPAATLVEFAGHKTLLTIAAEQKRLYAVHNIIQVLSKMPGFTWL